MTVADEIKARLKMKFEPQVLEVHDESEKHIGHAGYREGGESHFRVVIAAPAFGEMSRIARHRAVHEALGADLVGRIHALALQISA
jgi:BolA family transcriptional regulator, general stress-responsive regulator